LKSKFPYYKQPDAKDCGPTCLRIIAKHYGKLISLQEIREYSETTRSGSNLLIIDNINMEIIVVTLQAYENTLYRI
jgi:ABC-type bacteriocin/lantibiotic exporter with double-glycine peptidase domain